MDKLDEIIMGTLGIPADRITDDLSRDNCEEWDSFNHLLLISEIERNLQIKFTIQEVAEIKSRAELKKILSQKNI